MRKEVIAWRWFNSLPTKRGHQPTTRFGTPGDVKRYTQKATPLCRCPHPRGLKTRNRPITSVPATQIPHRDAPPAVTRRSPASAMQHSSGIQDRKWRCGEARLAGAVHCNCREGHAFRVVWLHPSAERYARQRAACFFDGRVMIHSIIRFRRVVHQTCEHAKCLSP